MRLAALLLCASAIAAAQGVTGDVIGIHDLSPSGTNSPVTGNMPGSCSYCHAAHSGIGGNTPLWNQKLSTTVYTPYSSTTDAEIGTQPIVGGQSSLCLSCHDGTVAPGQTAVYGTVPMKGSMSASDKVANLQGAHPVSVVLPMKDSPDLASALVSQGKTLDPLGTVKLINGNIECTTCHNPHVQATDTISQKFQVRDSSSGQLCLACHDPNRVTTGKTNPLAQWTTGIHATATNSNTTKTSTVVGEYANVAANACNSCHVMHNAPGQARLLRGVNEQDCIACHGGGTNISPAAPNVFAEFSKTGHPLTSNGVHDAGESVLLNQNRHSTCADCHNAHSANQVTSFPAPPALRVSQNQIAGISANDGVTIVAPAVNQYENCLRCHGTSTGKAINPVYGYAPTRLVSAGDPLNIIPQFALSSSSSHPVTHDSNSPLSQPSLRPYMTNLDGVTQGRSMGVRILCTDCHNSDDNREFGGSGPNGPHGSKFTHILERRYEFSQAPAAGALIVNLFPNPDKSAVGPYGLCAKCHDLNQVVANTSFNQHALHINEGFSCSVCHTSHGMGATSGFVTGERMVNFDMNVVAANGTAAVSYNRATNTCTLTCHNHAHPTTSTSSVKAPTTKLRHH
jgi:predicted CXXCH cytochrome family protein